MKELMAELIARETAQKIKAHEAEKKRVFLQQRFEDLVRTVDSWLTPFEKRGYVKGAENYHFKRAYLLDVAEAPLSFSISRYEEPNLAVLELSIQGRSERMYLKGAEAQWNVFDPLPRTVGSLFDEETLDRFLTTSLKKLLGG